MPETVRNYTSRDEAVVDRFEPVLDIGLPASGTPRLAECTRIPSMATTDSHAMAVLRQDLQDRAPRDGKGCCVRAGW
eukprot:201520-Alexandrium_andersonii.AAC.1